MYSPHAVLRMKVQKVALMLREPVARLAHLASHALGLSTPLAFLALPRDALRYGVQLSKGVERGVAV
jgi:hypothetical protein